MNAYAYRLRLPILCAVLVALAGCGGSATDASGNRLTPDQVYQAAASGDLNLVMIGLENGTVRINDQDAEGRTLLHYAAAANQADIIYWLLEDYMADPNAADSTGKTPLTYARAKGFAQAADMIERSGGQ